MTVLARVVAPLLNVNEPAAQVVAVGVREGDRVDAGAVLCALETTKAAAEVTSPAAGIVRRLSIAVGDAVAPDQLICILTEHADDALPAEAASATGDIAGALVIPDRMRLTKPARALATEHRVDLSSLPLDRVITADDVRALLRPPRDSERVTPARAAGASSGDRVIVFGGGGHGRTLIDMLSAMGTYRIAGVVDDGLARDERVLNVVVLGNRAALAALVADGIDLAANGVGGIQSMARRVEISRLLADHGFAFPILRHPRAAIEPSATIGDGAQLMANCYVGSMAAVGRYAIVNTSAVVSHDCVIGEHAHIAPGALLAGGVTVGARTLVGMGVAVALGVSIGEDARIGNGAVINGDVPARALVIGGTVWPPKK